MQLNMFEELKFLARRSYRLQNIRQEKNYAKLIIRRPEKKTMLIFRKKPPADVRGHIRAFNYKWSRKHRCWYSYLGRDKARQIKDIYLFING